MPSLTFYMDILKAGIRRIAVKQTHTFIYPRTVNPTTASFDLNISCCIIYSRCRAYGERSNMLTHLVALYHSQAAGDDMNSECKSRVKRRPLSCLRPLYSIPHPHISKPAGRFHIPNLPPPPTFLSPLPPIWSPEEAPRPPKC